jgi:hypothetical protein
VPIISRFLGIIITINYREHGPPHFHAWYSGKEGTVNIVNGSVNGDLPRRIVALLLEWWHLHRTELSENWDRAQAGLPVLPIDPLE